MLLSVQQSSMELATALASVSVLVFKLLSLIVVLVSCTFLASLQCLMSMCL